MTLVVFPKNYDIAADCDGNLVVGKDTSDVKGFHLYRDINGHSPEFRVESNQTAVGSYLSVKRASISSATTHAAVRFLNAAGATEWQIGTRAADNSFKIAYSSDGSSFTDIVTVTTAGAMTYGGDITLSTTSKLQFRDTGIYINSGADGKITISADGTGADDITLAGTVEVSGASITPATTDQSALGTTSKMWSDLFLASAGVINFNNGNVTITHAAGVLTVDGAAMVFNEASADLDFRVESNGMAYGVYLDGGKDALVLGSNTDTSSADQLITVSRAARTATAATNYYDLIIAPAGAVTVPAGVTAIVSTARFNEPNITATGTVTLAATIYLASQPSEGSQNAGLVAAKDVSIAVGDAAQARLLWESADADANALLLQLPAGGATDVPVLAIGQSIENVGLGLFDGVVDPNVVMFGAGAVTTGPRLRSYKARGTIAAPTAVTTGDDLFSIDAYGAVAAGEYVQAARILFEMTGTIATTRGPGVITFQTATDAAPSVLTTAMTISAAQLVTCASLTSTGAFTASSTAALNGNVTVADDILLGIGTGNTARLSYDTTDENANELLLQLPAGGGTDVPVVVIGQAIESVDLGLYDGVVDPRIAMFGVGAVTTGSVLEFRKARGTVAAPTVCTTGDDLGTLDFYGAVAAGEYVRSASIRADIAGTIATTRGPGTLTFLTATDAAPSVLTAALTLGADQSATFANRLLLNGVAASGVTDGSVIRMGTSGSPLVDDQAGAGFVVGYFDSGATSGWPAGLFISTNVTGAGGSFTALQGDAIVTAEKATVTGIESFFQFATPGRVTGAARACQATIDFGNYDFGSGGVYSAACFNIKGEGAAVDIGTVQRVSCLELKTEGTFSAVSGENFDTKPAGYAIYFNGFTAASGVTNILSSTRLAELPAGTIGIRVGVGSDGAAGDVYYIPLVPAAEWN